MLLANEEGLIGLYSLQDLFNDLHLTNHLYVHLPNSWTNNKAEYYQKLFQKLQETKNNLVRFNIVFLFVLLEGMNVPSQEQLQKIKEDIGKEKNFNWERFKDYPWYFFEKMEDKGKFLFQSNLLEHFYFEYRNQFLRVLYEMFLTDDGQEFDMLEFYKHFYFLLRGLYYSEDSTSYQPTFFQLSYNL
jgi:hypothetical protein